MKGQLAWILLGGLSVVQAAVIRRHGYRRGSLEKRQGAVIGGIEIIGLEGGGGAAAAVTETVTVTLPGAEVAVTTPVTPLASDPNVAAPVTPVIISGASSNHGIVIVSLPTTTPGLSTTEPVVTSLPALDTAVPQVTPTPETSLPSVSSSAQLQPLPGLESTTPAVNTTTPDPALQTAPQAATSIPLLESLNPLPTTLDTLTTTPLDGLAAETSAASSLELGLINNTPPAAEPEITSAPGEVQNPAAGGQAFTLDQSISLTSDLNLGNLGR